MTTKKGSLSINYIITAVIALVVLGIIIYLIATPTPAIKQTVECGAQGGKCISGTCGGDAIGTNLCGPNAICCPILDVPSPN